MDTERIKRAGMGTAIVVAVMLAVALVINAVGGSWHWGPLIAFIAVFALVFFLVRAFGPTRARPRGSNR
jgi:hypothetical protein